ncbi:MAG: hypothetical protein ABIQ35_15165 [Verrucomicrobiota bacterium]
MKKLVLIALAVFGVGMVSSQADGRFVISFGGGNYRSRPVFPVYVEPYTEHDAYHQERAEEHADLHHDLRHEHKDFHRATRYNPGLRREHAVFHRELRQEHGAVHHEAYHDHEDFHNDGY